MRYIFYDTETTGLKAPFDQILQFAALEVDENLEEVSSINLRCRILPHIIPSPAALLITRVDPSTLSTSNYSHLEMIQHICKWVSERSPSMVIGHNSIEFDENFLRQALYQCLHPVYLTNTNGNARGDTMRMAQAVSVYAPGTINVPLSEKGNPSFKLGPLTRANNIDFDDTDAHDALADVRATLELARLLRKCSPEIFEQMLRNASKKNAIEFMKIQHYFCSTSFNRGRQATHLVSAIATKPNDDGQMAVFDMAHAPSAYLNASVEQIRELMNGPDRVIRVVAANKQPIICDTTIGHRLLSASNFSPDQLTEHVRTLREAKEFRARVAEALGQYYEEKEPSEHIEERIYEGFPSGQDARLMEEFHRTAPESKHTLCQQFEDIRFTEFGLRLIYAENPDHLPPSERDRLNTLYKGRFHSNDEVAWMTFTKARADIDRLRAEGQGNQALLSSIEMYINTLAQR